MYRSGGKPTAGLHRELAAVSTDVDDRPEGSFTKCEPRMARTVSLAHHVHTEQSGSPLHGTSDLLPEYFHVLGNVRERLVKRQASPPRVDSLHRKNSREWTASEKVQATGFTWRFAIPSSEYILATA